MTNENSLLERICRQLGMGKRLVLFGEEHKSDLDYSLEADIIMDLKPKYILSEPDASEPVRKAAESVGASIEDCDIEWDEKNGTLYYLTSRGLSERRKHMARRLEEAYRKSDGDVVGIVGAGHLSKKSELLRTLKNNGVDYIVAMREESKMFVPLLEAVPLFADVLYKIKHG